jgi:hypothetical protein
MFAPFKRWRKRLSKLRRTLTGTWAPDNSHLSFAEKGIGAGALAFIIGADGSGLRQSTYER